MPTSDSLLFPIVVDSALNLGRVPCFLMGGKRLDAIWSEECVIYGQTLTYTLGKQYF